MCSVDLWPRSPSVTWIELQPRSEPFQCADDATKAAEKQAAALRFHTGSIEVHRVERPVKRKGAGRPKKGEAIPTEIVWTVTFTLAPDDTAITAERRRAS